jgi:hypothetical protein
MDCGLRIKEIIFQSAIGNQAYLPNTRTTKLPGMMLGRGRGRSGVGAGGGPNCAVAR